MTFSIILFVIFTIYLLLSYRKALLLLYPLSLLITTLPAFSGISLKLSTLLIYEGFLYFFIFHKNECKKNPLTKYIVTFLVCHILCYLLGAGTKHPIPFMYITANILYTYVVWCNLTCSKDLVFFSKCLIFFVILIVGNGIIEFYFQENLWFEWLSFQTSEILYHSHINDIRMGYGRCCSFFDFCIPFGDVCAILFSYYLYLLKNKCIYFKIRILYLLLILLIIGILLANSRAAFIIFFLSFIQLGVRIKKSTFVLLLLLCVGLVYFQDFIYLIIESIFDSNKSNVQGSNSELRHIQFLISLQEFIKNPLFGNMGRTVEIQEQNINAAGLESHLFILMINYGLVGIIAYISNFISGFAMFPKGQRFFPKLMMVLWVLAAFTSLTTGVDIAFPIILLISISKMKKYNWLN